MKAAVFGASGYGGQVLMRLLLDHPEVTSVLPVSSSTAGDRIDERDSGLGPDPAGKLPDGRKSLSRDEALARMPDAVFSALPHGASAEFCEPFIGRSVVFDLSADFRLRDVETHHAVYGHPAPLMKVRSTAVYGLAEVYHEEIRHADLIAVPGCYPTCTLLPLIPLARNGMLGSTIVVNSLSGISGAGRAARESSLYVERSENAVAYNPGRRHRHHCEMVQELAAAGSSAALFFTPHLVPMRRGMISTISIPVVHGSEVTVERVRDELGKFYSGSSFIRLTGERIPATRDVTGSNRCDIGWILEDVPNGPSILYLFSAIDNLVKGASGQAVQDFNIRFGFPETAGLPLRGDV